MSRVFRPLLLLLLIFAIGFGVIYLDQTNQLPAIGGNPANPSPSPSTPQNGSDPYNQLR